MIRAFNYKYLAYKKTIPCKIAQFTKTHNEINQRISVTSATKDYSCSVVFQ